MNLDFDKELAVCEALETDNGMAEETCLTKAESRFMRHAEDGYPEALRRLKRLRELFIEKIGLEQMPSISDLLAWSAKREAEYRELLNIQQEN